MADVKLEVTRFGLATGGATQDITISGFGTPKAAIFIFSNAVTDDTIASDLVFGVGFTDGTRQNCNSVYHEDGVTTTDTDRISSSSKVVIHPLSSWHYSFNSWITDGVRINVDAAAGSAVLCTCILVGGSDVSNAYVNYKDDLGTGTSAVDITDPGFEPDLVFITGIGNSSIAGTTQSIFSFGVGHNDGVDTQRVSMINSVTGSGTSLTTAYVGNDSITGQIHSGALSWDGVIGAYDASGFSITPNSSAGLDIVFYLALKFTNNPDIDLFDLTIPTSGNYAETNPGFTPNFGLICGVQGPTARNSVSITSQLSAFISAFDDNGIYTTSGTDEDAASTMVCKSLSSDQFRVLDYQGSADAALASGYAFDSSGWDFTLSTNPGAAILGWGVAVGAGGSGTTYNVSASLGLSQGLTQAGTAQAVGGLTLSQSVGCSDTGGAQALAAQTYSNSFGFTASAIIAFFVDVTFNSTMGQTHQGTATGRGTINLGATLDHTISAIAQTLAQVTLSTSNGLVSASGQALSDSISLGISQGLSHLGLVTFGGSITLSKTLADQVNAVAQANAALNLGAQVGLSVLAQAAAQAGITLSQVVSVVNTGSITIFGITTPDGRVYTIEIDTRTLTILAESRTYTVN